MDKETRKGVRGAQRTTREDWVQAALEVLVDHGIEAVRIATLAARLDCARSSFYWYFKDRETLLNDLIDYWQSTNTEAIINRASANAASINCAVTNVFACWAIDMETGKKPFDSRLDFAMRDWGRKDEAVHRAVNVSDDSRISAIKGMFERFGYDPDESSIRARILYYTQIGHEALGDREHKLDRAKSGPHYLFCLTGIQPSQDEADQIAAQALRGMKP